ncbi:amino acid adenylation domain-containing protein [Paenibacillus sp. 1_12]|uniref:non-ribosomal peptide synthetase n=1 Tax=Paenibacillus sp. 1_12 TaxID=1566278 RepID=UPI0008DF6643|nr:amino acid adenylation domain-containing protein [Paenibacillus sp. 1_12]SFL80328.1 amino acid adenylation domain-containing protein [Paenibacillus sp. 1_12]
MIFSCLQMAWGIVLMKYHDPDHLQLHIDTTFKMPMWTCNNTVVPRDNVIVLDIPVCMEDTLKEWMNKLRISLASYAEASGVAISFAPNFTNSSASGQETASDRELEVIMDADRQLNSHLHSEISADRFIGHLKKVYEALIYDEQTSIKDINILLREEQLQLLYTFNQTRCDYPKDHTIHGLFTRQAAANPEQIAVVCNQESLSYAELERKSTQLAVKLQSRGVGSGSIVAITADRTVEMVIGLLAILKSGAAYLPIDLRAPEALTRMILTDSGTLLAVSKSLSHNIGVELVNPYDPLSYDNEMDEGAQLLSEGCASDLAYVIYTSGTTGTPKGVMVHHQGVINFCCWLGAKYRMAKIPRILQSANLTFDASVESIFGPLLNGGTLYLIRSELLLHKGAFRNFIDKHQVQIVPLVPSLLSLIADDNKLESVQVVITGGDILEWELKDRILKRGYKLYNHYGPTEVTVDALSSEVEEDRVTLGKPIANTRIYVLTRWLQLCPVGVWGEICIAGDGLALGYLNRKDLTQEKFIANPHEPGQLMYRTGDIGRWLEDGRVEYGGRIDDQLKINGILVHPETIRKHLMTYPAIIEACVMGVNFEGKTKLFAYYTAEGSVATTQLREHLLLYISPAILPSKFIEVAQFPVNLNGKLNKHALVEMAGV